MSRSPVMDSLEEQPPEAEPWAFWILAALVLSIAAHLAFFWWALGYPVKIFSDSYYEEMVPRAFKVDRVEIDARLLDNEDPGSEPVRKITPAPVDLPPEDITAEKPTKMAAPATPAQLGIEKEPVPKVGLPASDTSSLPEGATLAALDEDLHSMREALLAEQPSSSAQPALTLASAAEGAPGALGESAVPSGYSNLDDLLAQTGGLSATQAPIFMPSDVLFGYDESFLRPEAITSLEKLGELIRRNPDSRFRIEGHTDTFGGGEYNSRLSLERAESVRQWLAAQMGIDPSRIDTRGFGSTRPLVPATGTIEEQQLNRRVEIVILRPEGGR